MKKLLFVPLVVSFFHQSLFSQDVAFGVRGGLNLANLTGDVNDNVKGRTAFHIGALAEIELTDQFYLQPELQYSSQGFKLGDVTGANDYLNLPIMGKFYPIDFLYLETGPQIGFLLSANEKDDNNKESTKDAYKGTDFAWNFGAGYKLTDIGLSFGIRYNLGFTDVLDVEDDASIKNGVFQISVSYLLFQP